MLSLRQISAALWACILSVPLNSATQSTQTSAQTTAALQPSAILQQSLAAQVGNTTLSDITLTGTVRRIAGSDDETGSAMLQAVSNGSARLTLNLPSGTSTEIANLFGSPTGTWSGPDSISHPQAFHNLLSESAWFAPSIGIARRLSSTSSVGTYVGHETLNGQAVEHIAVSQTPPSADPPSGPSYSHLSQVDFYIDSTTLLPAAISFNIHPDNDASRDIPVQILLSNYQTISGVQVPLHVQKFFNNSLSLDLQVQSTTINTGLTAGSFNTL